MTFHTLLGPSDPRVLSGILARKTLNHLQRPVDRVPEPVAMCILNFIRLVDMYRYGDMRTEPDSVGIFESEPFDHGHGDLRTTDPLEEVQKAMDKARREVFGDLSRKKAATRLHNALIWHLEIPDKRRKFKSKEGDSDTRKFLKVFIQALPSS